MTLTRAEKIALFSALISSPLITIGVDLIRSIPPFSTLKSLLVGAWDILVDAITFKIPLWSVILFLLLLFYGLVLLVKRAEKKKAMLNQGFNFLTYTEDIFDGLRWKWKYNYDTTKNQQIINDHKAYCPRCDSILRGNNHWIANTTKCIRCKFSIEYNVYNDIGRIDLLIIDSIEKKQRSRFGSQP